MAKNAIHPRDLVIRCYVEQEPDGSWFAMCIDLNLCAQGDSLDATKQRLHAIILDYIDSAMREHQDSPHLLRRRAPLRFVIRYHSIALSWNLEQWIHRERLRRQERYEQAVPMVPANC